MFIIQEHLHQGLNLPRHSLPGYHPPIHHSCSVSQSKSQTSIALAVIPRQNSPHSVSGFFFHLKADNGIGPFQAAWQCASQIKNGSLFSHSHDSCNPTCAGYSFTNTHRNMRTADPVAIAELEYSGVFCLSNVAGRSIPFSNVIDRLLFRTVLVDSSSKPYSNDLTMKDKKRDEGAAHRSTQAGETAGRGFLFCGIFFFLSQRRQ